MSFPGRAWPERGAAYGHAEYVLGQGGWLSTKEPMQKKLRAAAAAATTTAGTN
jgi:hypothetical protein